MRGARRRAMRTICANAGVQRRTTTAASDGDGVGCEPDEPVAPPGTRYRLALLTEAGRPLEEVRRGESFEHVVSSPDLPVGIRTVFWICGNQSRAPASGAAHHRHSAATPRTPAPGTSTRRGTRRRPRALGQGRRYPRRTSERAPRDAVGTASSSTMPLATGGTRRATHADRREAPGQRQRDGRVGRARSSRGV